MNVTINKKTDVQEPATLPICDAAKQKGFFRLECGLSSALFIFDGKEGRALWVRKDGSSHFYDVPPGDRSMVYRDDTIESVTISFPEYN